MIVDPLIRKLEQFEPLSPEARTALEAMPSRLREYGKGELIVEQGSSPDESAIVVKGCAFRFKRLADGERQIVALHVPGDFVDLHSFVLRPMDHSVTAACQSIIARVPHAKIAEVLKHHPHLTRNLMWDMALDAAIAREWMAAMGLRPAPEQIAHLLCEMYFRMRRAGLVRDDSFEFVLTQQDIGDLCGMSAVHVNRSLQALRARELIEMDKQRVTVLALDKLIALARFDSAYLHLIE
ncbi:MAG: Crp/Fnr family transcriptional regulator [Alphaproteobacteria bacterium]|nr:Crp/Fnr family transcriptional regulator [Alphaproteobacteria bacterium]